MDFTFLLNPTIIAFLLAMLVFGIWEIAKAIKKTGIDAKIITSVNGTIAVLYGVFIVAFGLETDFWQAIANAGTVFAIGSFFDLLKAYGAVKPKV